MADRAQLARLILRIERDLLAKTQLQVLLAAADTTIANHRRELRNLKASITRMSATRMSATKRPT